jgi:hypothetical protein
MAVQAEQVPVGTTAVDLTDLVDLGDRAYSVAVTPTVDLFVGPAGVTAATGYKVPAGSTLGIDLTSGERLYGITASGTGTAYVLRSGMSS